MNKDKIKTFIRIWMQVMIALNVVYFSILLINGRSEIDLEITQTVFAIGYMILLISAVSAISGFVISIQTKEKRPAVYGIVIVFESLLFYLWLLVLAIASIF